VKIVLGDLVQMSLAGEFDVIVQGCNCFCRMRRGIAKTSAETFPEAVVADNRTKRGAKKKLGTFSIASCHRKNGTVTVVNAYTQHHRKGAGTEVLVDYMAVRSCMKKVREQFANSRIALPLIGAGLAKGDWSKVERIILEELAGLDVTIVHFEERKV
jgi:O-acetyl-ADP-ribose deacetylase (regulator of RNase III)